ncbi:MAG: PH domain-containing protein [Elusimicrobiaceae bacterium]|nr:PH domain-containing protein [Elusimicrobiaceae bacterium]
MRKIFPASHDRKMLIITVLAIIFMLAVALFTFLPAYNTWRTAACPLLPFPLPNTVPAILVLLIIIGCRLFAPEAFEITDSSLIIRRPLFSPRIALQSVTTARMLEAAEMKNSARLFGVGGLFGSYGCFRNKSLGRYLMYATKTTGFVLVEADGKKFALTPDQPETFIAELRAACKLK